MTISHPDGTPLTFSRSRQKKGPQVRVHSFGVVEALDFGMCPICGTTEALTREHVPQGDLGGTVMTYTCAPCNNGLGSRVEGELRDWFDGAIGKVRFSGGDVPGKRKVPRILLRTTADDQVGLIIDEGKSGVDIGKMLASGSAQMHYSIPNPRIWRVAAMKHGYLAACLALGDIPDTPHAQHVRSVLVATRDSADRRPPESKLADGLRVARSYEPAQGPTILLVALVDDAGTPVDYGFSFAGTLFVSWPLDAHLFWEAVQKLRNTAEQGEAEA